VFYRFFFRQPAGLRTASTIIGTMIGFLTAFTCLSARCRLPSRRHNGVSRVPRGFVVPHSADGRARLIRLSPDE
jgi:hypothetical protein